MSMELRIFPRDGCRGGREQFTWDSLKEQEFKNREQYLGQSTRIGMMGKMAQYTKNDWYLRGRETPESIKTEQESVQSYEEALMQEALGLKPKKLLLRKNEMTMEELKEFMKSQKEKENNGYSEFGGQNKKGQNDAAEDEDAENNRGNLLGESSTKGLGYAAHRTQRHEEYKAAVMGTKGELQGSKGMAELMKKYSLESAKKELKGEIKGEIKGETKGEIKGEMKGEIKGEVKDEFKGESKNGEDLARQNIVLGKPPKDEPGRIKPKKEKKEKKDKKEKKREKKEKKAIKKATKAAKKLEKLAAAAAMSEISNELKKSELKKRKKASSSSDSSS